MKNLVPFFLVLCLTFLNSCENEPIGKADPSQVIEVDSELYTLVQKVAANDFENEITCIDFNYAFTLVVYNQDMEIMGYQVIHTDSEFSDFMATLEEGQSISLSYPITSTLQNGEAYEINNNEELKAAIDQCLYADTIITCNHIISAPDCIWKIDFVDGEHSEYSESYFEMSTLGNVALKYGQNSYPGTWVTYFIEDQLHLNIFIDAEEEISSVWNFDWKVNTFTEMELDIDNGTDHFILNKECPPNCMKILFEECETEPGSGVALFDLESYYVCYFPFTGLSYPAEITVSYYETYEDSIGGVNAIESFPYQNTQNPQVIYIRFEDLESGEPVYFMSILLEATSC